METWNTLVVIFTLCTTLHGGVGLPVVPQTDPDNSSAHQKIRTKRCSCNNQLDSECHYFCHLDIIWVNTPSKTTVYGLGGPLARRRRSTGRCFCSHQADQTCSLFCHHSSENPAVMLVEQGAMTDHATGEKVSESTRPPLVWESSSMSEAKTKRSDFLRKMAEARRRLMEKVRLNKHGYR